MHLLCAPCLPRMHEFMRQLQWPSSHIEFGIEQHVYADFVMEHPKLTPDFGRLMVDIGAANIMHYQLCQAGACCIRDSPRACLAVTWPEQKEDMMEGSIS